MNRFDFVRLASSGLFVPVIPQQKFWNISLDVGKRFTFRCFGNGSMKGWDNLTFPQLQRLTKIYLERDIGEEVRNLAQTNAMLYFSNSESFPWLDSKIDGYIWPYGYIWPL